MASGKPSAMASDGGIVQVPGPRTTASRADSAIVSFSVDPPDPEVFNLTTIWTPPCNSVFHLADAKTKSCLPPDASPDWITDGGYYSPGICFGGYTSGCDVKNMGVKQGQTAAMCVPSGWKCGKEGFASDPDDDTQTDVPAFEIRWEEDDLSILETHPQTPEAITTSEPTGETTTDPDSGPAETPNADRDGASAEGGGAEQDNNSRLGGVSRGAVAGIAVGVALTVILLCAAAFFLYRRRYLKPPPPPPKYGFDSEKHGGGGALPPKKPREIVVLRNYPVHTPRMPKTPLAELCAETTSVQRTCAQEITASSSMNSELDGYPGAPHGLFKNDFEGGTRVVTVERELPRPVDYLAVPRSNASSFEIKRKPVGSARRPG